MVPLSTFAVWQENPEALWKEMGFIWELFLMLNSSLEQVLTALSGRESRRCRTSFQNFHLGLLPCTPCNVFSYAITFLVVIPDLSLFKEQETSFTCQLTSLNFVLPHLVTFSVVLKEQHRWNLRRQVRTSHTEREPATWFSVIVTSFIILSTDRDSTWTTDLSTNVHYQLNLDSALTWHQARKSCQQQNAELLSITDIHEQTYFRGKAGKQILAYIQGLFRPS